MKGFRSQSGFTVVELLVVMVLFSVVVLGFYSILYSGQRGATTTRDVSTVSQEARLGFNRMVRDTRAAAVFDAATSTSYAIRIDFDGDTEFDGDFEQVTFAYESDDGDDLCDDAACITIRETDDLTTTPTILMAGVQPLPGEDVFSYSSNLLEYDENEDGVTDFAELDAARLNGASLLASNLNYISHVTYAFEVVSGDSSSTFFTQAQVRNARSTT